MPHLLTATRLLERTMPATARRLLAYGAIALADLASILLGAGTFYGLASFAKNPAFWGQLGALVGLGACLYGVKKLSSLRFYRVDLIHLLAMALRLTGQELPSGKAQLKQLEERAFKLFPSVQEAWSCYLSLRQLVLEAFAKLSPGNRLERILPQPLATWLQKGLAQILLVRPGAEAILAVAVVKEGGFARAALSFCEHYATLFRQSLIAGAFLYGLSLLAFLLLLQPVAWIDAAIPSDFGLWRYVFALILTYWIKAAFLDPIVTAAMMIALLELEEQTPSHASFEKWRLKLNSLAKLPGV